MAKAKVLTISRDPALSRFIQRNLTGSDYQIAVRQDSDDGLRHSLDEERPDLILLDIIMPSLDGIEACLRIRQWCLVPIIMLSTWGAGEGKVRGLNLGAEGYLTEPFGIDELVARIKEGLRRNLANPGVPWER